MGFWFLNKFVRLIASAEGGMDLIKLMEVKMKTGIYLPRCLPQGEWSESARDSYGLIEGEGDMYFPLQSDITSRIIED